MWNKAFEILQKYSLATVKISPWSVLHLFKFPLVFPRKPLTSSIAMGKNLQHLPLLLLPVLHTSAATAPVGRAGCHSLLQKFSNQCWMVSLPPDWCKPFPELSYSAILPLQVSVLPLSTCIDTEESGRHWNGDVVAPGNPAGLGEILALLQELGNLLLASRKRSACSHSAVLTQRRSISTRNKALQLWESPCFLLFKHPGPGWVRGPDLTCGHGEKLDSVPGWGLQHQGWGAGPLRLPVYVAIPISSLLATSGNLSCCSSTTDLSAKLPGTSVLCGIWALLHNVAVN